MKNKKDIELKFELPGFERKDIKVNIKDNFASISAEKRHERKINKKDFFHHEKTYRSFSYSTTLPSVNPKKARTEFRRGVLRVRIPKKR